MVGRDQYLTRRQKIVQARVYAQGLTIAVAVVLLALEKKQGERGRGETIKDFDPSDPTHTRTIEKRIHHERYKGEDQWRDMVVNYENRINKREIAAKEKNAEGVGTSNPHFARQDVDVTNVSNGEDQSET